ncbi:MAG: hypothetical protein ABI995_01995 [Acidobacteriota bacterium]
MRWVLLSLIVAQAMAARSITIVVTDEKRAPIEGATVDYAGGQLFGPGTDRQGRISIETTGTVAVVRKAGYRSALLRLSQDAFDVVLPVSRRSLAECPPTVTCTLSSLCLPSRTDIGEVGTSSDIDYHEQFLHD